MQLDAPALGMLIGGLVTAATGLLATFVQERQRLRTRQAWATFAAGILMILSSYLANVDEARSDAEIRRLNERIADSVTGGNSFCEFGYLRLHGREGSLIAASVTHHGKQPLYDVTAGILDLDMYDQPDKTNTNWRSYFAAYRTVEIGNLPPSMTRPLPQLRLLPRNSFNYRIFFSARNGFFNQDLHGIHTNNNWLFSTTVKRDGRTVYKHIDVGFPVTGRMMRLRWRPSKKTADLKKKVV